MKMLWLLASCLMVAALVLASCAPAAPPEEKPTPTPPTPEKPAPVKEKPVAPVAEKETIKLRLTKLDGTVVEKQVEKPKYGGVLNMAMSSDILRLFSNSSKNLCTKASQLPPKPLYLDKSLGG